VAVGVEGRPVESDLELHDGAGLVLLDQQEKGRGAVHRVDLGDLGSDSIEEGSSPSRGKSFLGVLLLQ
jgi:hypothetical protein